MNLYTSVLKYVGIGKGSLLLNSALRRTLVLLCAGAGVVVLVLGTWYWLGNGGAGLLGGTKTTGRALIGGAFTLTDHEGKTVTETHFRGHHTLVYFGYTFCPDVCPTELQAITEALEQLGPKAENIVPLFITVDPERDTVSVLSDYAENFHPRLRALTGTLEQVRVATRAYRVYFKKAEGSEDGDDYLMDHTSLVYFMGPDGAYVTHFGFGTSPDEMAARLAKILG